MAFYFIDKSRYYNLLSVPADIEKINKLIYLTYTLATIWRKIYQERLLDTPDRVFYSIYKGPEIPCLRIIKKCSNIKTAINQGKTKVCKL